MIVNKNVLVIGKNISQLELKSKSTKIVVFF